MLCKYCGYQIKQGIKICPNCGRSVSVDSEGMRHDEDTVFETEADYRRAKPKRQPQRDNDDDASEQPRKMSSGIKAVIIVAVVVLAAAAGVLFALKGGYLKSLFSKTPETSEEASPVVLTTKPTEPSTAEDNTGSSESAEYKTGYYKITKETGAAMYTSNRIYNENASHIVANGKYVEIKAFEYNDSYTLGFAVENGEFYGWIRMSDAEYSPDYKPESTTKSESTTAKTPETTTVKPAEPTTKAPETTTAKPSTGRYKVSDSVGDNLNVRKGPGTDYDVVDSLDIGTGVTVVEWDGNWAHISVNGNDAGYVYGAYLDKE